MSDEDTINAALRRSYERARANLLNNVNPYTRKGRESARAKAINFAEYVGKVIGPHAARFFNVNMSDIFPFPDSPSVELTGHEMAAVMHELLTQRISYGDVTFALWPLVKYQQYTICAKSMIKTSS